MAKRVRSGTRPWTDAETTRLLKAREQGKTIQACAALLGRTPKMVEGKLRRLGATRSNSMRGKRAFEIRWSAREERTVRCAYGHCRADQIAQRLSRTRPSIYKRAILLGVSAPRSEYWSHADLALLLTQRVPPCELRLGSVRTRHAVCNMKVRLRQLWRAGQLVAFLASRPDARKAKPLRLGHRVPPGLDTDWVRLSNKAKEKRARECLTREAERDRQKAAFKKWQARASQCR